MKPSQFLLTILISIAFSSISYSQGGVNNIWYFGKNAGLDFSNGSPVALTNGSLSTYEGCASMCNSNGELLFYTDGITVWDSIHQPMANSLLSSLGGNLGGDSSSTQSALIVPKPLDPHSYYVFTTDANSGAYGCTYSIINMLSNGGLGDVDPSSKNTLLFTPSSEKITAVKHANNIDYWIITHPFNSGDFRVYLLTSNGLDTIPIISTVGAFYSGASNVSRGYLKASPNGEMVAAAIEGLDKYELFHFDKLTGQLSLLLTTPANYPDAYGVEFSPNGTILYGTRRWGNPVFQWDLSSGIASQILASQTQIATLNSAYGGAMQLAPNDKIYIARNGRIYLSVINNPDLIGVASIFVEEGIQLNGELSREGLPNIISSALYDYDVEFTSTDHCFGDSTQFTTISSFSPDSVLWDFDDPGSGLANLDTSFDATHIFSAPGVYTVQLYTYNSFFQDTIAHTVEIVDLPTVSLPNNLYLCEGDTFSVAAISNLQNFAWSTGDTTQSIDVFLQGVYSVSVSNVCGIASDSIEITVNPTPLVDLGPDTISSPIGMPIVLESNVTGDYYDWNTGHTSSSITVTNGGTYYLTVGFNTGCDAIDSIYVYFYIGIEEEKPIEGFNIFPNPANQKLNIISKEKIETIKIYTASGQLVNSIQLNEFSTEIKIMGLSVGVYYLKAELVSEGMIIKQFSVIHD